MKKTWLKRLIAVSLAFIAAGTGTETMLYAQGNSAASGRSVFSVFFSGIIS